MTVTSYADAAAGWQAYQQGQLDYWDQLPYTGVQELLEDPERREQLRQQPLLEYYSYEFQLQRPPYYNNTTLRRGLNYAVDRQAIIEELLGSDFIAAKGVIPQGVSGYRPGQ
jgi:ABC-type oligopeptide transport system substrate-binding subunit